MRKRGEDDSPRGGPPLDKHAQANEKYTTK